MTFSISVPDRIGQALQNKADAEFGQGVPEFLKSFLFAAAHSKEGVMLKLDLPAITPDPRQTELPLGGGQTDK